MGEHTFGYTGLVDELRCHTTEWLEAARVEAVQEQRRWRVRELAILRVLDERGRVDDTLAGTDGVSVREVRESRETARLLDQLPEIANAAHRGALSDEQLAAVTRLAEPGDDGEWAQRAPHTSPEDLQRLARTKRTPTVEDGRKRRQARNLGFWWRTDAGMLDGRFSLPDVDGALFERVMNQMINAMKPIRGQPWETRARRGADALMELVRNYAHVEAPSGPDPYFVVHIPPDGPAEVAGIPLPDDMVEALRAQARVEPVLTDPAGIPTKRGRTRSALAPKVVRGVKLRDGGRCRWPGCDRRTGLQVHHLWPVSWGGTDDPSNLALVCVGGGTDHHAHLAPSGKYLLLGNPNLPDGLHLLDVDQLAALAQLAADQARTRSEAA